MSYRLIIRPEAEADMAEAFDWYEARKAGLGHEFLAEIRSVLRQLEETRNATPRSTPKQGALSSGGFFTKCFTFSKARKLK